MPDEPRIAKYIVPDWARSRWKPGECTIEKTRTGFAVICHATQTTVAEGTYEECVGFLSYYGVVYQPPDCTGEIEFATFDGMATVDQHGKVHGSVRP